MLNRRGFLKAGGLALFSTGMSLSPLFLSKAVQAAVALQPYQRQKIVVTIFQRGGMDGIGAVTPYTDPALPLLRPKLLLPTPNSGRENALIDLDGKYGLHPAFSPLAGFFKEKRLAVVHGVGNTFSTRSHLDAAQYWESGTPGNKITSSGWLNRALSKTQHENDSPLRGIAIATEQPRTFHGNYPIITVSDINKFGLDADPSSVGYMAAQQFDAMYSNSPTSLLRHTGKESIEAMRLLSSKNLNSYKSANNVDYPKSFQLASGQSQRSLGDSLRQIAQLIKANVGLQAAYAETTGFIWDTHVNEHAANGPFFSVASDFSRSVAAFWQDLGTYADDVILLTMTEFGRTVAQNETSGTDHGRGTCMFVLGNNVQGGKVYGNLPDRLEIDALEDKQDLPVSTDYRAVVADIVGKQFGISDSKDVFPTWSGSKLSITA